jgi:hypothetical protein
MNYEDFLLRDNTSSIPQAVYKPQVRCPYCQSVHLADLLCESCGRSLLYHPIGEAFSFKSYTGLKEKYIESLGWLERWFPLYEDKLSPLAQKYSRQLEKRFDELLTALQEDSLPKNTERRYFYIELIFLIDELLDYGKTKEELFEKIERSFVESNQVLSAELLKILNDSRASTTLVFQKKIDVFLQQKMFELRREFIFKSFFIVATLNYVAITYYEFFSSLVGK